MSLKRLTLLFLLLTLFVAVQPARADFTEPQYISDPSLLSAMPDIAEGPDGKLHAVWADNTPNPYGWGGTSRIAYSYSGDGGGSWSPAVPVFSTDQMYMKFRSPKVLVDKMGNVHVSATELQYYAGYGFAVYARSADMGKTWNQQYDIIWGSFPWNPNLASGEDGKVYMAWNYWKIWYGYYPDSVFMKKSSDWGASWAASYPVIQGGLVYNDSIDAKSVAVDDTGKLHLLATTPTYTWQGGNSYLQSTDNGDTWQDATAGIPAGFSMWGVYCKGGETFIVGTTADKNAFIRSGDGGATWGGPYPVSDLVWWPQIRQIATDGGSNYHTFVGASYFRSSDAGATWADPEYMGNFDASKMLLTKSGEIVIIGQTSYPAYQIALAKHRQPVEVMAPSFLSVWEKGSFLYSFQARGTGTIRVAFPSEFIDVGTALKAVVGTKQVDATITVGSDGKTYVEFPIDASSLTTCSVPFSVKKGIMTKSASLSLKLDQLDFDSREAAATGDFARLMRNEEAIGALKGELSSVQNEFVVELTVGAKVVSARTKVSIYEKTTSEYAHFKANPPDQPADLLLLSDGSVTINRNQPLKLEVKVTRLTQGTPADASLTGGFQVIDVVNTNTIGTKKTDFYLFYPSDFIGATDTITIYVEVAGKTTAVPFVVNLQ